MVRTDYHVHTKFSSDSQASMESMIEKAIQLGYTRICFTDHMDYDFPKSYGLPFVFDVEDYAKTLKGFKEKYKEDISILMGIECGMRPYLSSRYEELIKSYPFDFVICSSHLVGSKDPYHKDYWKGCTEEEGISQYFETILENIHVFDHFDVYGHLDYVVRYGPTKNMNYSYDTHKTLLDNILTTLIQKGKGIEINTAGYKYGLGSPHPTKEIISRYLELGGTILTIGSDAHKPEHMHYAFDEARALLLSLGVTHYTVFENRIPIQLPL